MKTKRRQLETIGLGFTSEDRWVWPIVILIAAAWAALQIWPEAQKYFSFRLGADMGIYAHTVHVERRTAPLIPFLFMVTVEML